MAIKKSCIAAPIINGKSIARKSNYSNPGQCVDHDIEYDHDPGQYVDHDIEYDHDPGQCVDHDIEYDHDPGQCVDHDIEYDHDLGPRAMCGS